jgi:tyrosyl-tRNA synthetase
VTALVHSPAERDAAVAAGAALFGRAELADLSADTLRAVVAEVGGAEVQPEPTPPSIVDLLERSGVVASKGAARRAIAEGGAYVNNRRVADPAAVLADEDRLHGRYVILRRGKRTVGAVTILER